MYFYHRLLGHRYYGFIVRLSHGKEEYYNTEDQQWYETGIMICYYSDESDQYGMYEEVTEKEAQEAIK